MSLLMEREMQVSLTGQFAVHTLRGRGIDARMAVWQYSSMAEWQYSSMAECGNAYGSCQWCKIASKLYTKISGETANKEHKHSERLL